MDPETVNRYYEIALNEYLNAAQRIHEDIDARAMSFGVLMAIETISRQMGEEFDDAAKMVAMRAFSLGFAARDDNWLEKASE